VRITAQLIQADSDQYLWAESYERDLQDVLALQSEVAAAISKEIKAAVTPLEQARLSPVHAINPEIHEAYLRGLNSFNQGRDLLGTERGAAVLHSSRSKARGSIDKARCAGIHVATSTNAIARTAPPGPADHEG
jgi:hypothetical protein